MAARSSSSSNNASNSTDERLVALDSSDYGSSYVIRVGVKRKTSETESPSLMGQLNNSQKAKGNAIINGAADLDERSGGEVVTPKNLGAESSHSTDINDLHVIECGCCFRDFQLENMVQCSNGHRFCFRCLRRRVEEINYGGLRAHGSLYCMSTYYCTVSIPMSEIRRALPNDVIERYEYRQAQEAIVEAKLEGLVYCPFCNIQYIVDVKCVEILDCPNPKCLKASCIQCKKPSHIPLQCKEVEKMSDSYPRTEVEEKMSKAVIRECNICHVEIIKTDGCNKVICRCGNIMCYVCRQIISLSPFNHFCSCSPYYTDTEDDEEEDDEALGGKKEALKEFVDKEPKLLDLDIGPSPEKSTCKICNKCSVIDGWEEDNQAVAANDEALKELVDKEPKLLDLDIGPSSEIFGHGYRFEKMAVTPPLPVHPPQFFGFGEGDQVANMVVPPPHYFGFGDGDQLGNIAVPPPQFFRDDDQLAKMELQAQEDYGREEQVSDDK